MANIVQFGSYVFPVYAGAEDEQIHESRSPLVELPASDGAFDVLGDDSYKAAGRVVKRFTILGDDFQDVDDRVDALLAAMNQGRQRLYWEMRDSSMRWAWAKKLSISMPPAGQRRLIIPVAVTFQLAEGYRYSRFPAGPPLYGDAGLYGQGLLYGQGQTMSFPFAGVSTDVVVTNVGNANALPEVVVSCGGSETAVNVKVARRLGGADAQWFQAARQIEASKVLEVDCAAYSVEYDDADDYDSFSFGADQVEWLHLEPGDNDIRITCDNAEDAGTISFIFYPTYH